MSPFYAKADGPPPVHAADAPHQDMTARQESFHDLFDVEQAPYSFLSAALRLPRADCYSIWIASPTETMHERSHSPEARV
jgi:hypothetical protein